MSGGSSHWCLELPCCHVTCGCAQGPRGPVKGKAVRLKVPGAQPYWGAELPGQMPGIAGAILGGKAQERVPDPARELVGV